MDAFLGKAGRLSRFLIEKIKHDIVQLATSHGDVASLFDHRFMLRCARHIEGHKAVLAKCFLESRCNRKAKYALSRYVSPAATFGCRRARFAGGGLKVRFPRQSASFEICLQCNDPRRGSDES